ncbi:MAG: phage portal protein, partial [Methylobacter tundripaludum]|nr:phage portal protein [Methylobacter tundripaludum]
MGKTFNRYIMTDGVKSIDLPQFPNEAWTFYGEDDNDTKIDLYASVASVYRALNLTANVTASIPFAIVSQDGKDVDISDEWTNKVGFMPKPKELIRLWRLSLSVTNSAYGFMEKTKAIGRNLRYIVPSTIVPDVDNEKGLIGFKRNVGNGSKDYKLGKSNPIFWMWRMDHTTELLPAKATEFQAMCAAAGILYYSDNHIQAFFKRGGIKPTMLVLKGMTTKDNIDKIESIWDKIIRGGYRYLGKIFQGVDAAGGLEAQTIGEGVDNLKDETLTKSKIEDVAMAMGIPLSLLLANSANYATAQVEYKSWYDNGLQPWCDFMADEMTEKLFAPLGYRFVFRPEMTDAGQEEEVQRAGAYSTYVTAKIKPSIAAQIVGIELPEGIEYEMLDQMQEEADQKAADAQSKLQQDKLQ